MPQMQWLQANEQGAQLRLRVWLDTAQTQRDSTEPDDAYVRDYRFAAAPPDGVSGPWTLNGTSYTDWRTYVLAEARLLAAADYAALTASRTALPVQGEVFTPA